MTKYLGQNGASTPIYVVGYYTHLASSTITPAGKCGSYAGAVVEIMCVVYVSVTKGAHR